jgi:hypothetical protein
VTHWRRFSSGLLASSLGTFGQILEGNERREEALASFAGGVRTLTRHFQELPAAHEPVMSALAEEYVRLSQGLGPEPEMALLAPVAEGFNRLQKESPPAP